MALLGFPLTVWPAVAGQAAVVKAAGTQTQAFDEATAAALAKAQGARVEVSRLRTQTDQVFKNPDGTTTTDQYLEPVRVRRASGWVPVDSTLTRGVGGSLVPAASAVDMAFSAGGTGPLVSVSHGGVSLALTWPAPLPAPTVSGDTATYPEVYPGVDLTMTSAGTSFTEHLIVKTAAAGRQLGVRSLTLGTKVTGGRLVATAGGGFTVVDRDRRVAWSSPAPSMWDSSSDASGSATATPGVAVAGSGASAAGPRLGQDDAREGDHVAALGQRVDTASMLLTPDASLLDSPSTVFPVTIDPTTGPGIYNWAMVDKTYPTTSYYNFADADQGVGYQNYSGVDTKRLFFAFNTSGLLGKTVQSAALYAYETYSGTCAAGTVDAYLTANFGAGVTWNSQPAPSSGVLSSFSTKAGRSDCQPGGITAKFDATWAVQARVAEKYSVSTFRLMGHSETTVSSWMRFAGPKNATVAYRPHLSVTYNSVPNTPSTSTMKAPGATDACATTAATAKPANQTLASSREFVTGSDPDGGNLTMTFSLYNPANGSRVSNLPVGPLAASGSAGVAFSMKIPTTWSDGTWYWKATLSDGTQSSVTSGPCYILLDHLAPPQPTVTSTSFVQDTLSPPDIAGGAFTFAAVGAASFDYYWNGVSTGNHVVNGTSGGTPAWTGNVTIPVTNVGWLEVIAVDAAGNRSPKSNAFYVKKAVPGILAQYLFNDPTTAVPVPVTVADSARGSGPEDLIAVADRPRYTFNMGTDGAWDVGKFAAQTGAQNASLSLGGTGQEADTVQPPAVSARSFTIGAWVNLTDDSSSRTVIAQNLDQAGGTDAAASSYDIGYDQVSDRFVFHVTTATGTVTASDALPASVTNPDTLEVISLPHTGAWVYLAAIYDATAGTIRLDAAHEYYHDPINDPFTTKVTVTTGAAVPLSGPVVAGTGVFRVGDGGLGKSPWAGMVDNVSVWQRALSDVDASSDVAVNANNQL